MGMTSHSVRRRRAATATATAVAALLSVAAAPALAAPPLAGPASPAPTAPAPTAAGPASPAPARSAPAASGRDASGGDTSAAGSGLAASSGAAPGAPLVPPGISRLAQGSGRGVAITIDDGPDPVWTPQVLQVLRENHVKATFCLVGTRAQAYPELVRRIAADGHQLCDHSVDHDVTMDHKPVAYQSQQILDGKAMIEKAVPGVAVTYYRAPGGAFTPASRAIAAAHGMRPLGWSVDPKDWSRPGLDAILSAVETELPERPTVLFHDGGGDRSQTVAALKRYLPWLTAQGYAFTFPARTTP
ncbi:polysaccharide deacetylase family protein [Streptomyces antimicrobicus]|uniref:Polysaccharide deacetylase family protein n=1 Tax=Streptomyces antimicrobicus TaxID=2883108 RepID=A0ABS8B2G0_9ACTN|nr:polysaccharide deacetylase family protein [Streptomyces antimicrobicus]MCB5178796.1 polysaccharide deacetylase family protein [Streptomyces antimicrobicus]